MPSKLKNIKKTVIGELSNATATTWKYLKIGRSRLSRINTNKSLSKTYRELGIEIDKEINNEVKKDVRQSPKVINLINKIKVFKQDIMDNKLKIQLIKKGSMSQVKNDKDTEYSPDVKVRKKV